MTNDPATYGPIAGILAMAFATYFTRVIGLWLMGHVPVTVREITDPLDGERVVGRDRVLFSTRADNGDHEDT